MQPDDLKAFAIRCESVIQSLESDNSFRLLFYEEDPCAKTQPERRVEMLAKKALLYSDTAVFVTRPFVSGYNETSHSDFKTWRSDASSLRKLFNMEDGSVTALGGCFVMIPDYIQNYVEYWDDDREEDKWYDHTPFRFEQQSTIHALPITLENPTLSRNFLETLGCTRDQVGVVHLTLPQLHNIPFDVLLRLREDEGDAFSRFHYAVKKLVCGASASTSERSLLHVMEEVDYEVRTFRRRLETLSKSRLLTIYEAVIATGAIGLCLALPSEFAKVFSAAMGSFSAKDFAKNLFGYYKEKEKLKESDFYVPWLCTQLSENTPNKKV